MRCAAVALAVLVSAGEVTAARQPARPPRDVQPTRQTGGPASITGKVTAADTGVPLRQAIVSATSPVGFPRETVTDDGGRFEIRDLQPGPWELTVSRSGYISRKAGQSRPFGRSTPIALAGGQEVNVAIPMTRASAIVGRISDEYGEPVTAVRVVVLRPTMAGGRRYLEPVGEADMTDDTGAFRVHSLPAGEYFVTASARTAPPDSVVQTTLPPTFYPGTADFAAAQKVRVGPGAEAAAEFALLNVRSARLSGFVVAARQPVNAILSLASEAGELAGAFGAGGVTRDDGSFTMADVPPGNYTLIAEIRSGPTTIAEIGVVAVSVTGADIEGLTVPLAKPGTLRGTIVADAGVKRRLPDRIEILARPRRTGADGTWATANGSAFEISTPPGPFTLDVEAPPGWSVKSMTLGGLDASDLAIDVAGEQNVPVTVVLTDQITELSGTVAGADSSGAYVVVFPADSGNWTGRRMRSTRTDPSGRFRIAGLPPGQRYLAIAVRDLDQGQESDPDFLQQVQASATAFDLSLQEKRTLELKVLP